MRKLWMLGGAALVCGALLLVGAPAVAQDGCCGCYEDECGCYEECGCGCGEEAAGGPDAPAWTQPTKAHEDFKKMVGDWVVDYKFWMAPGQPPMQGRWTAAYRLIFGGLYLEQVLKGDMMGHPFEGRMILGYDTINKEFVNTWIDSTNPVMTVSRGKEENGAVTMYGDEPDWSNPMTGTKIKTKTVVREEGPDKHTVHMWQVRAGTEVKVMEMTYTRKK